MSNIKVTGKLLMIITQKTLSITTMISKKDDSLVRQR